MHYRRRVAQIGAGSVQDPTGSDTVSIANQYIIAGGLPKSEQDPSRIRRDPTQSALEVNTYPQQGGHIFIWIRAGSPRDPSGSDEIRRRKRNICIVIHAGSGKDPTRSAMTLIGNLSIPAAERSRAMRMYWGSLNQALALTLSFRS